MKRIDFTAKDGKSINLAIWDDVSIEDVKGVVQIAHGMAEHIARYDDFAKFLNANGYVVIGDDHRAHGRTDAGRLGLVEKGKDLFEDTVSDLAEISDYAKKLFDLPLFLLGHSYGSFLTQAYLMKYSDKLSGCVLSGSALYSKFVAGFGKITASLKSSFGADKPGKFFAKITFGGYDKTLKCEPNGWLSRCAESNDKYAADELSGFVCSNGFYKSFFTGLLKLAKSNFSSVKSDLPLMIAYGSQDCVGGCGKLIRPLVAKYTAAGLAPIVKEYVGARHEILNETNNAEVYGDLLKFFDSVG